MSWSGFILLVFPFRMPTASNTPSEMSNSIMPSQRTHQPSICCHISNISKIVPHDTIHTLFSLLGPMLVCDISPNLKRKDGTLEADIVYANPSDALLAIRLSPCELGDKVLEVEMEATNTRRLNLTTRFEPKTALLAVDQEDCRTLILPIISSGPSFDADVEAAIKASSPIMACPVECTSSDSANQKALLLEYGTREEMLRGMCCFSEKSLQVLEVTSVIDPDARINEISEVMMYGVPIGVLLAAEKKKTTSSKHNVGRKEEDGGSSSRRYSPPPRRDYSPGRKERHYSGRRDYSPPRGRDDRRHSPHSRGYSPRRRQRSPSPRRRY